MAQALKEQGNAKFQAKQYEEAIELYTEAIELDSKNAALYSNRSVCHLIQGSHAEALSDAQQAAPLRPDWEKGHFRTGAALEAMGDLEKALPAYQRALDLNPMSEEIIGKVRELKRKVKPTPKFASMPQRVVDPKSRQPYDWSHGLSPDQQAEWLVDCYRMRLDDDYAWGDMFASRLVVVHHVVIHPGCNLHGLYDPDATRETVAEDFLIFCKLAVAHKVTPPGWDWNRCLGKAAGLLPYAFKKEDAKDKWGGENIFAAAMGGRSLRYTGEVVYGSSCMAGGGVDATAAKDHERLEQQVQGQWRQLVKSGGQVFADVGGAQAWKRLFGALSIPQKF